MGSAPGNPRHTGHVFEFGASPKFVEQPQNAFVRVSSCACTSRPITASYRAIVSGATRAVSCAILAMGATNYIIRGRVPAPRPRNLILPAPHFTLAAFEPRALA